MRKRKNSLVHPEVKGGGNRQVVGQMGVEQLSEARGKDDLGEIQTRVEENRLQGNLCSEAMEVSEAQPGLGSERIPRSHLLHSQVSVTHP